MHGWQSKSIDGPKGGRSCAFRGGCGCSGHLNHNCWMQCGVEVVQGIICSCSCSCSCIVVVAVVDLVVVVMLQLQLQLQQPLQSQLQLQLQLQWWRSVLKCGEVVCVRSIVGLQLQLQLQLYCSEFVVLCSVARLNVQKCSERGVFCKCQFFALLTSKSASRHNGLHFLNISTSKGALNVVCFVHVDFKIYFAPQRRALFNISTSKSALDVKCFYLFHFQMCFVPQLRAIFHLSSAKWLRTRRFSEPTSRPSGATNHWKNTVLGDFPTFSRTWIFFLLGLFLF